MPVKDIIDTYKKNRISLHDNNDNILIRENPEHDQYMWVPAGLEKHLVSAWSYLILMNNLLFFGNIFGITTTKSDT